MFLIFSIIFNSLSWAQAPISELSTAQLDQRYRSNNQRISQAQAESDNHFREAVRINDVLMNRYSQSNPKKPTPYQVFALFTKDATTPAQKANIGKEISRCIGQILLDRDTNCHKYTSYVKRYPSNEFSNFGASIDEYVAKNEKLAEIARLQTENENILERISDRASQMSGACQRYISSMHNKISLSNGTKLQTRSASPQLLTNFRNEYSAYRQQGASGAAQVESLQNLKRMAEVINCHGQGNEVRSLVTEIDNELKNGIINGYDNCQDVERNEASDNALSQCIASFYDSLPSSNNEGINNAEQFNRHIKNINAHTVLDHVAHKTIDESLGNLAELNARFGLGFEDSPIGYDHMSPIQRNLSKSLNMPFGEYVAQKARAFPLRDRPERIDVCNGRLDQLTDNVRNDLQRVVSLYDQELKQMGASRAPDNKEKMNFVQLKLNQIIAQRTAEDPEIGAFVYTPEFLKQFEMTPIHQRPSSGGGTLGWTPINNTLNVGMEMSFQRSDCASMKRSLAQTLSKNVKSVASPEFSSGLARDYANWSFKNLTFESNQKMTMNDFRDYLSFESVSALDSNTSDDRELDRIADEIFAELPELRTNNRTEKNKIAHIKMLLRASPEMMPELLEQFKGNARLICLLSRSARKDSRLQPVIDQELKLLKGIAKTAGVIASAAGFFVNPAIGFMLASASGAVSQVNNALQYDNLKQQVAQALGDRNASMNRCLQGLGASQGDSATFRLQCEQALETLQRTQQIEADMRATISGATTEMIMYAAYLAPLMSHTSHGMHDLKKMYGEVNQLTRSGTNDGLRRALTEGLTDHHVLHGGVLQTYLHHVTDMASNARNLASGAGAVEDLANISYTVSKGAKALYYAQYLPATAYPFVAGPRKGLILAELADDVQRFQRENQRVPTSLETERMQTAIYNRFKTYSEEDFQRIERQVFLPNG